MDRESALASVSLLLTLALASPTADAQIGRTYYRSGLPGISGSSCSQADTCHQSNPLSSAESNRVMKAAGSVGAIFGSPDAGMQAVVSLYDYDQLEAQAGELQGFLAEESQAVLNGVHAEVLHPRTDDLHGKHAADIECA